MRYQLCLIGLINLTFSIQAQTGFSLKDDPYHKKVEVLYDEKLLTAYCYFDSTEKPILFPVKTVSGVTVTRGYPIAPHLGERTDHPHQVGLWMNYENVNDLDFWNNSFAVSAEKKSHYGSIRHQKILKSEIRKDNASLIVLSNWVNSEGKVLLEEITRFVFIKKENDFIVDRIALLEAKEDILFKDVKDGLLGIRVARELEMPSVQEDKFVDAQGNVTPVPKTDNTNVSGMYFNKERLEGDKVWGERSRWVCLQGEKDGEKISIAIIDHPKNVGFPTYWHARGYGLFAANPLGQKIFSEGKKELNFSLEKGRSTSFRYRVIIHSSTPLTPAMLNKQASAFASLAY